MSISVVYYCYYLLCHWLQKFSKYTSDIKTRKHIKQKYYLHCESCKNASRMHSVLLLCLGTDAVERVGGS